MQKLIKTVTLSVALSLVSGCSYFGVYKRDLPQGNMVDQEMVSQLQPGMSREQVRSIMGTPLLEAPFDAGQWDYVFYVDEAYDDVEQRRVTLTFQGNRLANIETEGDIGGDIDLPTDQGPGPAPEGANPENAILPTQPNPTPEPGNAPSGGDTSSEDDSLEPESSDDY